jgi:hypothetical protein
MFLAWVELMKLQQGAAWGPAGESADFA